MTHAQLTEPSLSPHARKGREGNREGNGGRGSSIHDLTVGAETPRASAPNATAQAATMDGLRQPHVHLFVPQPDGRLYGKVRWRNRCACGQRQHPEPPRPIERGPMCRRCGFPTVLGTVDLADPVHPCCAEPALMALGRRTRKAS